MSFVKRVILFKISYVSSPDKTNILRSLRI